MILPHPVTDLMRRQHGLIARWQALALGVKVTTLDAMVHTGYLERVERGVYRWPGSAEPPQQRLLAAVLRAGKGARIDGARAAALHGIEGFSLEGPISVVVPCTRTVTGVTFAVHEGPDVLAGDRAVIDGVDCVAVARVLIELAADGTNERWRVAYDDARRSGLITPAWLERRARANVDLAGADQVITFLGTASARQESEGERRLGGALRFAPVQPEWGVWLLEGIRVDAVYLHAKLVLEYDGRETHTLDTDIAADLERQRRLEEAGWMVVRITARMLREDLVGTVAMIERLRRERELLFAA